jgi:hypothetical protein
MKTRIIESVAEPVAPVVEEYPMLMERMTAGGRQIVLATSPSAGTQIAYGVFGLGPAWGEDSSRWLTLGFTRITRPITIEFTP